MVSAVGAWSGFYPRRSMTVPPAAESTSSPPLPWTLLQAKSADWHRRYIRSIHGRSQSIDCVTYIETILALARASNIDDFIEWLRKIRYDQGRVRWERRNHYMTRWIRNNVREGIVRPVSVPAVPIISRERVLNVVPGLATQRTRLKCVPKLAVRRLAPHLQSGDLIFFASTRKNLDVFHAGIIVREGKSLSFVTRRAARAWSWNSS